MLSRKTEKRIIQCRSIENAIEFEDGTRLTIVIIENDFDLNLLKKVPSREGI